MSTGGVGSTFLQKERGVGLIEVMVALLIFSTMITGLLSIQILAMQASRDAVQRSVAVVLARDLLARIRSNPGVAGRYIGAGFGGASPLKGIPERDCRTVDCSPIALADFDLWHWESSMLGLSTDREGRGTVLQHPGACITFDAGRLTLDLFWRGTGSVARPYLGSCVLPREYLYDDPAKPPGNRRWQSHLQVSSFVGESPG